MVFKVGLHVSCKVRSFTHNIWTIGRTCLKWLFITWFFLGLLCGRLYHSLPNAFSFFQDFSWQKKMLLTCNQEVRILTSSVSSCDVHLYIWDEVWWGLLQDNTYLFSYLNSLCSDDKLLDYQIIFLCYLILVPQKISFFYFRHFLCLLDNQHLF